MIARIVSGPVAFATVFCLAASLRADEPTADPPQPSQAVAKDFDKTYRLDFTLVTANADQSFTVVTSQSVFALRYGIRKEGEEYSVTTAGTLSMLDKGDRVRVSYKFDLDRSDNNGDGFELSNTGSAIVTLGKPKTIAQYGEYQLKLTATVPGD